MFIPIKFDHSRIVTARETRGMSQIDLASKLDITSQQLSKWERGEVVPSVNKLADIANAIECPVAFFYVESGLQ